MSQLQDPPPSGTAQCEITGKWVPEDELVEIQGKRVCAEGKQILLDRLMAGESLPGELEPPGVLRRWGCSILDGLILGVPAVVVMIAIGIALASVSMTSTATMAFVQGLAGSAYAIIATLYFTFLHARDGQSLGKKVGRIKVVRPDGSPINLTQSFWRAFFFTGLSVVSGIVMMASMGNEAVMSASGVLDLLISVYMIANVIALLVDRQQQRALHDRIAGTRVVMAE